MLSGGQEPLGAIDRVLVRVLYEMPPERRGPRANPEHLPDVHPHLAVAPRTEVTKPGEGVGDVQAPVAEVSFDMTHCLIALLAIQPLLQVSEKVVCLVEGESSNDTSSGHADSLRGRRSEPSDGNDAGGRRRTGE